MTNCTRTILLAAVTTVATAVVGRLSPALGRTGHSRATPPTAGASLTDIRRYRRPRPDQRGGGVRFADLRAPPRRDRPA